VVVFGHRHEVASKQVALVAAACMMGLFKSVNKIAGNRSSLLVARYRLTGESKR
jgi:hypothetical protein